MGRKKEQGVFLRRNANGEWGNPVPVEISAVSVGPQVGRDVREIVVIYRTEKAVDGRLGRLHASCWASTSRSPCRSGRRTSFTARSRTARPGRINSSTRAGPDSWSDSLAPRGTQNRKFVSSTDEAKSCRPHETERRRCQGDGERSSSVSTPRAEKAKVDSPETARLKAVLTAMTNAPKDEVAGTGANDPKVRQASGGEPLRGRPYRLDRWVGCDEN